MASRVEGFFMSMNIQELALKRAETAARKAELQGKLMDLNHRIHGRGQLPTREYRQLMGDRHAIIQQVSELDQHLTKIRIELQKAHAQIAPNDLQSRGLPKALTADAVQEPKKLIITRLNEIREKYQLFSADGTRSPTMRRMASEFVIELNKVIRESLSTK